MSSPFKREWQQDLSRWLRRETSSTNLDGIVRHGIQSAAVGRSAPVYGFLPSAGGQRRNVVMLRWEDGSGSPSRCTVVDFILEMDFVARDLFAFIHVAGPLRIH